MNDLNRLLLRHSLFYDHREFDEEIINDSYKSNSGAALLDKDRRFKRRNPNINNINDIRREKQLDDNRKGFFDYGPQQNEPMQQSP